MKNIKWNWNKIDVLNTVEKSFENTIPFNLGHIFFKKGFYFSYAPLTKP